MSGLFLIAHQVVSANDYAIAQWGIYVDRTYPLLATAGKRQQLSTEEMDEIRALEPLAMAEMNQKLSEFRNEYGRETLGSAVLLWLGFNGVVQLLAFALYSLVSSRQAAR